LEKFDAKLVTDLIGAKNDYENSIVTNKLNFFSLKLFFYKCLFPAAKTLAMLAYK